MATQCNEFVKISALNCNVYYLDYLDSEQDTFNEICCFIINEFHETDTIMIENKNQLIQFVSRNVFIYGYITMN